MGECFGSKKAALQEIQHKSTELQLLRRLTLELHSGFYTNDVMKSCREIIKHWREFKNCKHQVYLSLRLFLIHETVRDGSCERLTMKGVFLDLAGYFN